MAVEYLPKAQARKLYAIAQEKEEQVREERRERDMEEKRASAGGLVIQGGVPGQGAQAAAPKDDPVQKLQQLKTMLEAELISEEEFETKKAEILSNM